MMARSETTATAGGMGHNNPPAASLRETLAERDTYRQQIVAAEELASRATALPQQITDETLSAAADVVSGARELAKAVEAARVMEKQPHLDAGREIDKFFAVTKDRLDKIVKVLTDRITLHNIAKAAEARKETEAKAKAEREAQAAAKAAAAPDPVAAEAALWDDDEPAAPPAPKQSAADLTRQRTESGALVTTRTEWDFVIEDYSAIPLDRLRDYIPDEAITRAVRGLMKITSDKSRLAIPGVRFFEKEKAVVR